MTKPTPMLEFPLPAFAAMCVAIAGSALALFALPDVPAWGRYLIVAGLMLTWGNITFIIFSVDAMCRFRIAEHAQVLEALEGITASQVLAAYERNNLRGL